MHEMSLLEDLVGLIEEEGRRQGFSHVRVVRLKLGALGPAEPDALRFCFDAVTRGTIADAALLEIELVPGAGWCPDCGRTIPLAERFAPCPECGETHVHLTAGDELRLAELEVT